MNKLIFKYGVMGSSKTANLLMEKFNYEENNKNVLLLKPTLDTRESKKIVKSRIGIQAEAIAFQKEDNLESIILNNNLQLPVGYRYDVVMIDESQFLTKQQVEQLRNIVDTQYITVICYGLKTDFMANLFEGSASLFALADDIIEIERYCMCGNKAIINARMNENHEVLTSGEQLQIGFNYEPMCYRCWKLRQKKG